ncbi:MAG: methylamine utilization protein MauG, partial [Gammaproteobacteria bacterium]|nr:methylamine utilization protein MauG [Gammaproteobacteria bacterium]
MTIFLTAALLLFAQNSSAQSDARIDRAQASALASFGQQLFFDANLSQHRNQACATCHDPSRAFTDGRAGPLAGAVSLGDDGESLGDRNTPTTSYVALTPVFQRDATGQFSGGFFVDGRAATLRLQVTGPLLDPIEMALPDKAAIVSRVAENPGHVASMKTLFGEAVFSSTEHAIGAIVDAIAAFQHSEYFAPFDSKYDRYLRGDYTMTADEELGRALFFSDLTNCAKCHLKHPHEVSDRETFTNYRYHNIGITINHAARQINGLGNTYRDRGLASNPAVVDMSHNGKFKVPTLRNV